MVSGKEVNSSTKRTTPYAVRNQKQDCQPKRSWSQAPSTGATIGPSAQARVMAFDALASSAPLNVSVRIDRFSVPVAERATPCRNRKASRTDTVGDSATPSAVTV
jgi:hypothetical protein